ncbi:MAG: alkaline phosphatase [Fibrobacter sp.]|nr:alkaline phosphatase [Fibrobacter sp.]
MKGTVLEEYSRIELKTAEIAAYMPSEKKLFVVGDEKIMEVVDVSNPEKLKLAESFMLDGEATSVTSFGNFVAVSLLAKPSWEKGFVELLEVSGDSIRKVGVYGVCHHPDMLTFTPDGRNILVACEGEYDREHQDVNPDGGVAILNMDSVSTGNIPATILPFNDVDIEPEYITVSPDSRTAWVSLQENNAIARIDVENRKIDTLFDLGFVDHTRDGFGLDVLKDGKIRIENAFIRSLRQPDGIKAFEANGKIFVATANEGEENSKIDSRKICGNEEKCKMMYGTRSISLFDGLTGELVWDSGDLLEKTFAEVSPKYFNWNSKKGYAKVDARSDDKGCEPENITVGKVGDKLLGFAGLERMSGIATFDFSHVGKPGKTPKLLGYFMDPKDRGPEGILFIDAENSPLKGVPLLVVGYEYSKSLVIYKVVVSR